MLFGINFCKWLCLESTEENKCSSFQGTKKQSTVLQLDQEYFAFRGLNND